MATIHGNATWPGVQSVIRATYTCSHGLGAGRATLQMNPQFNGASPILPALAGTFTISDSITTLTLRDCIVDDIQVDQDDAGPYWILSILDRRWRWSLGSIRGAYNQTAGESADHKKLVPWTIRSPEELALLCLREMGETKYVIDLPPGLPRSVGATYTELLQVGANFPASPCNIPVSWEGIPPAEALQDVCERLGRRVIFDPVSDSVIIAQPGIGPPLPPGSIHKYSPNIDTPEMPDSVGVIGSPTRYTLRCLVVAVGKDFGDIWKPINYLSYAPLPRPGTRQLHFVNVTMPANAPAGAGFTVTIGSDAPGQLSEGEEVTYVSMSDETAADVATGLAARINANASITTLATASVSGDRVVLTGVADGIGFWVTTAIAGNVVDGETIWDELRTAAQTPGEPWQFSMPPSYAGVRATDRLTIDQAMELARDTVFRCFQLVNVDAAAASVPGRTIASAQLRPLYVPGHGELARRQQLVLLSSLVKQVVPTAQDRTIEVGPRRTPLTLDIYNGYSRDAEPRVYGSVNAAIMRGYEISYPGRPENTTPRDLVLVPFQIEPVHQIVKFDRPVWYKLPSGGIKAPTLSLETSAYVRDAETNALLCLKVVQPVPGSNTTNRTLFKTYPDIQLNILAEYCQPSDVPPNPVVPVNGLKGFQILEADPLLRAQYYLDAMKIKLRAAGGETVDYNTLMAVPMSGSVTQVTWSVGSEVSTVASRNTEHDIYTPPYPERRRAELLPSVETQRVWQQRLSWGGAAGGRKAGPIA